MAGMVKSKKLVFLLYLFIFLILVLGILSSCLYISNSSYQQENRSLIIQNDSILSININLNEELKNYKQTDIAQKNSRVSAP